LLHTIRDPWKRVRGAVNVTDTLMTGNGAGGSTKKNWSARDASIGCAVPLAANGISLGMMGNVEDADVTVSTYVYAEYGGAEFVFSGTYTIGGQEVVEDPTQQGILLPSYLYADTIVFTDRGWPTSKINRIDYEGDDGIAQTLFEAFGIKWLKVEIAAIDGGLTVIPIFKYW